ncbi:dihydrodipicolinate reductase [Pilibacter termitis]|uniref:4-hydroxy-tetrahydrodipicolinate reductase n=1 Tax=Pilibacter termitis TaxID=263852 RepID=A0A1T4MPT0_9ENTE|nr:4-hydroxy-tetrahydrodipicolinate reductase [Pilibacter termitis]SJZ69032.1 dihydrodipicolinate reductase [Pilibacter termitis]
MIFSVIGNGKTGGVIQEVVKKNGETLVLPTNDLFTEEPLAFDEKIEGMIDFSHPNNISKILEYVKKNNTAVVIGTTGLSDEHFKMIEEMAHYSPVIYSANYSLGVILMNKLVAEANRVLLDWDVEVIEKHHNQKVDAPSGTANLFLNTILNDRKAELVYGREGSSKRVKEEIGVHSLRGGTLSGEHEVCFMGIDEVLSVKHEAFSNKIFAEGAVHAATWLVGKPNGLYTMEDVLFK